MHKQHLKELEKSPSRIRLVGPLIEAGETNFDSLFARAKEVYKSNPGIPRSASYVKRSLTKLIQYLA